MAGPDADSQEEPGSTPETEDDAAGQALAMLGIRWGRTVAIAISAVALVGLIVGIWAYRIVRDRQFTRQLDAAIVESRKVAGCYRLSRLKRSTLTPEVALLPWDAARSRLKDLPPDVRETGERLLVDAKAAFARVLPSRRHRPRLWAAQADLAAECGDYDLALRLADMACDKSKPKRAAPTRLTRALVLLDRRLAGDIDKGRRLLQGVAEEMENGPLRLDPDVYYNLAVLDHLHGTPNEATRTLWGKYLAAERDPDWRRVAEHYVKQIPADE